MLPTGLFSQDKKYDEPELEKFEFIVVNIGKGNHIVNPVGKHGLEIKKDISIVRLQSISNNAYSVHNVFKLKGLYIKNFILYSG